MAMCHAEISHKNGNTTKVAYWNGPSLELIKQQCMRAAQQIYDQEMRSFQPPFQPTFIQLVVDEY